VKITKNGSMTTPITKTKFKMLNPAPGIQEIGPKKNRNRKLNNQIKTKKANYGLRKNPNNTNNTMIEIQEVPLPL
jgi:hypothetical protein